MISKKLRRSILRAFIFIIALNFVTMVIMNGKLESFTINDKGNGLSWDIDRHQHHANHGDDDTELAVRSNNKRPHGHIKEESIEGYLQEYPQYNVKINPHNFTLIINEPNKCQLRSGEIKPVFLLVLISSARENYRLRTLIRKTWGSVTNVAGENIVTMFLMGSPSSFKEESNIMDESAMFHDILMEDFVDSYRNLTFKTMMGMKWMTEFCSHANYVMKTDDDMFVNYNSLVQYLLSPLMPTVRFVIGRAYMDGRPIRDPNSKYHLPASIYNRTTLPPFCSGTGYVMSGDLPPLITMTSSLIPEVYLEDVFIGLCLEKLGILPLHNDQFNSNIVEYTYCRYRAVFTVHLEGIFTEIKYAIWDDLQRPFGFLCNLVWE